VSGLIPYFRAEPIPIPLPEHLDLAGYRFSFPQDWTIQPFGLLVATGLMVGTWVAERRGRKVGVHSNAVSSCIAHILITAFIIAHMFDALAYHPEVVMARPLFLLEIWDGLSSFGGFIGAIIGLLIYQYRYPVDARVIADPIAFSFPVGWLFGRTGCFVVHDHPGAITEFFLGVRDYEVGLPPFATRHDLGFYEVLWCSVVITLFFILGRTPKKRGFFLALLPLLYAPVRFGLDFLRATDLEQSDARYYGLTPGHYGSIVLFLVGLVVMLWVYKSKEPSVPWEISADRPTEYKERS
jgi:phosphatidylglycerol:prolipoprotein diacylglycerol transferase